MHVNAKQVSVSFYRGFLYSLQVSHRAVGFMHDLALSLPGLTHDFLVCLKPIRVGHVYTVNMILLFTAIRYTYRRDPAAVYEHKSVYA